jgi:hypothetical protein
MGQHAITWQLALKDYAKNNTQAVPKNSLYADCDSLETRLKDAQEISGSKDKLEKAYDKLKAATKKFTEEYDRLHTLLLNENSRHPLLQALRNVQTKLNVEVLAASKRLSKFLN